MAAKRLHFNEIIRKSKNNIKSTWNIINEEMGKHKMETNIKLLKTENKIIDKNISHSFLINNYF